MKIAAMHGQRSPLGNICLSFKTMKNTKIVDQDVTINSFYN